MTLKKEYLHFFFQGHYRARKTAHPNPAPAGPGGGRRVRAMDEFPAKTIFVKTILIDRALSRLLKKTWPRTLDEIE